MKRISGENNEQRIVFLTVVSVLFLCFGLLLDRPSGIVAAIFPPATISADSARVSARPVPTLSLGWIFEIVLVAVCSMVTGRGLSGRCAVVVVT